jgi:biotin transport system substrate-specific component
VEILFKKELITNKILCRFIGVNVFVILMILGAFVRIPLPFTPVPITLQTFFALLSGALLGNLGTLAQLIYLFLGLSGLTVFSQTGSGVCYLMGPTGGYIIGFILASFFIGKFIKYSGNRFYLTFALLFVGDLIILFSGAIWLKYLSGYQLAMALVLGFIPFLAGDLLKTLVAALIYLKLRTRVKEIF